MYVRTDQIIQMIKKYEGKILSHLSLGVIPGFVVVVA